MWRSKKEKMNFDKLDMKKITIILCMVLGLVSLNTFGQNEATIERDIDLEKAITLGLANNKRLLIQAKETQIADNNVYLGNAGLLPTVNLLGSGEYSNNEQELTIRTFQPDPPEITFDESGVESQNYAAVLQADYLLIGGFLGKYRYRILENQSNLEQLKQEAAINGTIVGITELFTQIAGLQSREELLNETIAVTRDRLKKIEDRKQFGQATGLDILRAQTDLNEDLSTLDDVILAKTNLMKQLNLLIGLPLENHYRVNVNYALPETENASEVIEVLKANNPEIKLAEAGVTIAESQLGLVRSELYPKLNLFANYGYVYQKNDIQQLAELENIGATIGASLKFNIFNGNKTRKDIQNAKFNIESQELNKLDTEETITTAALQELNSLKILENQLTREIANLDTFQETFDRTRERYYNGQATALDLRDTQTALLNAKVQVSDIKLEIVESGVRLESLKGTLLMKN